MDSGMRGWRFAKGENKSNGEQEDEVFVMHDVVFEQGKLTRKFNAWLCLPLFLSEQKIKTPPRKFQTFEEVEQRNQKRTADPRGGNRQPDMHHGKRLKKTVTWDYMKKTLTSMLNYCLMIRSKKIC
jgi:hypothetical protein